MIAKHANHRTFQLYTTDKGVTNFRIILHDLPTGKGVSYGINEVICDRKGNVVRWTEKPVMVGSTIEDLAREVDTMIRNLDRFPDPLVLSDLLFKNKTE